MSNISDLPLPLPTPTPTLQFLTEERQLVMIPPGQTAVIYRPAIPRDYVAQSFLASDLPSLIGYLRRQVVNPEYLAIYVDVGTRTVHAVLDACENAFLPGQYEHTARLVLELSPEFSPIHAVLGKEQSQDSFLNFIEANSHLFVESSKLLDLVGTFRQFTITKVKAGRNLNNGTVQMEFSTEEDGEQTTKIPQDVTAILPVFTSQPDLQIVLKLRYQVKAGVVVFFLSCPGVEALIRSEVLKVEEALREFVDGMSAKSTAGWTRALVTRGKITPAPIEPMVLEKCVGLAMPSPSLK